MFWRRFVTTGVFSFWNCYVPLKCIWTNLYLLYQTKSWHQIKLQLTLSTQHISEHYYVFSLRFYQKLGISFEQTEISFTRENLRQVLLKLAQWIWKKKILKSNVFSLRRYYLPKGTKYPFSKEAVCQVWWKFTQWLWWRVANIY